MIRLALAAAALACAIWLLPASVHLVAWSSSGPTRIAYLAPLSRLWTTTAVLLLASALLIRLWQRRGASLSELAHRIGPLMLLWLWVVPYLPWLPDRVPLLLVFGGRMRWVVAGMAAFGIVAQFVTAPRRTLQSFRMPRTLVFVVSFVVYATLGYQFARDVGFSGDEPHYLVITQSLITDHDLDIANNHVQHDYRAYFPGELRPDFLRRGLRGEIYSIHAPGLPALLVPAFAVGGALGTVIFIALLSALAAVAIFDAATLLATPGVAAIVWVATCFSLPFVPHAWLVYPEAPGALITAWATLWLLRPPASIGRTFVHGLVLAALPWLHTKFAVLLALFVLFEAVRLWPRRKQIAALVTPIAISGFAWLYSFHAMYGVYDPEAPYGSYTRMFVLAKNIPRGALGLLFDQKFGLLVYAPLYILVPAGVWLMLRDRRQRAYVLAFAAAAAAFFVSTTRLYMWWGGSSAPARFLVPIIPLLTPMVAVAIARVEGVVGRAAIALTIGATLGIALVTILSPGEELLYSSPHGVAALVTYLQGSAPLDLSLPTFTEENWRAPILALVPWLAALVVAAGAAVVAARRRLVRSVFWTAAWLALAFLTTGSVIVSVRPVPDRNAFITRGQLELLTAYDPTRTHAVDITHLRRLRRDETLSAGVLSLRRPAGVVAENPHVLEGPFELPEGRYEARVWFDAPRGPAGEAFVALSDDIALARSPTAAASPIAVPFDLPIRTPTFVGVSDATVARSVRRIDIAPLAILARSQRDPLTSHRVEPTGGATPGYIAYVDDHTYPEGGVFWTRDTEQGTVLIATGTAAAVRLILHVGRSGGPVIVETGNQRMEVDLRPDETREITVGVPSGARRIAISVRATRSFRPSEVDPKSDDIRKLGCQVRPILVPS